MSISRLMDKQIVIPIDKIENCSSIKRNGVLIHGNNVGEFQKHHGK